jgi:hypothetical protein
MLDNSDKDYDNMSSKVLLLEFSMSLQELGLNKKSVEENSIRGSMPFDASPDKAIENLAFKQSVEQATDNTDVESSSSNSLTVAESKLSKDDLANLLEGFASVLRGREAQVISNPDEKDKEIVGLKELLMEAQETIITLLNDRVYDRSKIAKLEAEIRLLPDLQSQANRAMGLALAAEDVQSDLAEVKLAVEKLKAAQMRTEMVQWSKPWWRRLLGQ